MSDLIRCTQCQGKKQIVGMGMLMRDCPLCKAIGWIENESTKPIEDEQVLIAKTAKENENEVVHGKKIDRRSKQYRAQKGAFAI